MDLNTEVHQNESCRYHLTPNVRFSRYISPVYSSPGTDGTYMRWKEHLGTSVGMVACRHIGTGLSVSHLFRFIAF